MPWTTRTEPESTARGYRPEVDGLRAVSVLAILFFHLDIELFSGGYVGVDVFFVISGYLITRNIDSDLARSKFSFAAFYLGRVRRLFPALAATLIATLVVGFFFLTPHHYADLGRTTVFAVASLANFVFWADVGYFDLAADLKPLLHTWSLAIEEQFYLLWPATLVLGRRYIDDRRTFRLGLVAAGILSLGAAEWYLRRDPSAVFYLMPFRLFEFATGALCLDLERYKPAPATAEAAVTIGLAAILLSSIMYEPDTTFPGASALLPCLGASLVIWAGRQSRIAGILRLRAVVWIGLLSYSIYLVHWPLIIYFKYTISSELGHTDRIQLLTASIVLAAGLHYLVENPLRRPGTRLLGGRLPVAGAVSACAAVATIAAASTIWTTNGLPYRIEQSMRAASIALPLEIDFVFTLTTERLTEPFPIPSQRNGVILGDSHGADLLNALDLAGTRVNYRHIHVSYVCQLTLGGRSWGEGTGIATAQAASECDAVSEGLRNDPDLASADLIVVSSTWTDRGLAGAADFIDMLGEKYTADVILMGPRFFFSDPGKLIAQVRTQEEANRHFDASKNMDETAVELRQLEAIARARDIKLIDLRGVTCSRDRDDFYCPLFHSDGSVLYWDRHHWTQQAKQIFGERLREVEGAGALY